MKTTRKILSLFMCFLMMTSFSFVVFCEESEVSYEETTSIEYILSPENYASVMIWQTGKHTTARAIALYYNTLDNSGKNLYAEHGSVIMSYDVPLKNALSSVVTNMYVGKGGMQTGRTIPLFYDFGKFSVDTLPGVYADTTDEYAAARLYTENYWPALESSYSYKGRPFASQLAHSILETTSGMKNYDVTAVLLDSFKSDTTTDYLTFATGRETSEYANGYVTVNSTESIPYLTLTYTHDDILTEINSATEENLREMIEDLAKIGMFKNTTSGAEGYTTLIPAAKAYVESEIFNIIENGGFTTVDELCAAYDEAALYAKENGLLLYVNGAESIESMEEIIHELGKAGSLENTDLGYTGYSELPKALKTSVAEDIFLTVENGGFLSMEEFYLLYNELINTASTDGLLALLNNISSVNDMESILLEFSTSGVLDKNTSYGNTIYSSLNSDMKSYIAAELISTDYDVLELFYLAYDKAVSYVLEIPSVISADNYATVHITKEGYSGHTKNAKILGMYYNKLYSYSTYAEFGSIISGFEVPLKECAENIKISYYVNSGGMQSGRTIPVFYDINKFDLGIEAGYYAGPVSATDTTEAVEATEAYTNAMSYINNYWPQNNSYSYSSTAFKNQLAYSILETSSGLKTYDVTDKVLQPLISDDENYITFATGRETSEYANGSFSVTTNKNIPKLNVTYNALSLLNKINSTAEEDTETLLENLGKAGILENGEQGYKAFESLNSIAKKRVASSIYEIIQNTGYTTFKEFVDKYDEAVNSSVTEISKMIIFDSENVYDTAIDAAGKTVTITAPVKFTETSGTFTAILAEYSGEKFVTAQTKDISYSSSSISFKHTLSDNATEIKLMIFDSLNGMKPLCKSVSDRDATLDGKKVLFIGDSYVYYGRNVEAKTGLTQESRSNDKGGFYQLCKANGIDVSVTNWSFGSHSLAEIFDGVCTETTCSGYGESHEDYLTDRNFDYVIVSPSRGENISEAFEYIMNFFKSANPNVKFVCLGSAGIHGISKNDVVYSDIIDYYETLREEGVIIADWGELVSDIIAGDIIVPDTTLEYNRSSFVVNDNYHPNLLAGYITSLFAYCAITGESATEQPYSYITDGTASECFDVEAYYDSYCNNGSNFPEILLSENDMKGIQKFVDEYLAPRGKWILDDKKVIFIGNSHIYRGMTVIEKELSVLDQQSRSNDTGYFYQLCKKNGCDVSVTNWTFSGHGLFHTFGGEPCTYNSSCKGEIHEDYLTDRYFDYVFINAGTGTNSEASFLDDFEYIMNFFKSANPNVKFVCLGTASSYGCNQTNTAYPGVTGSYDTLREKGVIIADWGKVITGIIDGDYTVPGAQYDYTKSSFIVSDEYHANALTGYITTLTAYCAVTGESAYGQPYEFYNDTSLNAKFNITNYINKYYTNGASDTNFEEIFESESDMRGIQQVIDIYLSE